jgi:hypothetical protein
MNFLYRYLIVIVACVALLIGVQIPNLVDQYQKRVDAHLREVLVNIQPFQEIANKYFAGDMSKLVEMHRSSAEKPFQEEGAAIEQMLQRKLRFENELATLNASLPRQVIHVLLQGDSEILSEVRSQYTYAVPLNQDALIFGAAGALIILMAVELLFALLRRLFFKRSPSPSL